jgi:hypothetical protein
LRYHAPRPAITAAQGARQLASMIGRTGLRRGSQRAVPGLRPATVASKLDGVAAADIAITSSDSMPLELNRRYRVSNDGVRMTALKIHAQRVSTSGRLPGYRFSFRRRRARWRHAEGTTSAHFYCLADGGQGLCLSDHLLSAVRHVLLPQRHPHQRRTLRHLVLPASTRRLWTGTGGPGQGRPSCKTRIVPE